MSRVLITLLVASMICAHLSSSYRTPKCGANSELRQCGRLCEPTCEKPEEIFCNPANPDACKYECRCQRNYVRNTKTNECVRLDQCPC